MKASDIRPKTTMSSRASSAICARSFQPAFSESRRPTQKTARARQVRRDIARIKTVLGGKAVG